MSYQDVYKKRDEMYSRYGGLMTLADVKKELGVKDNRTAKKHIEELGIEPIKLGQSIKYETSMLAKAIVNRRGMC